jgi:hypothetical protein
MVKFLANCICFENSFNRSIAAWEEKSNHNFSPQSRNGRKEMRRQSTTKGL